jgi:hypothetical protein
LRYWKYLAHFQEGVEVLTLHRSYVGVCRANLKVGLKKLEALEAWDNKHAPKGHGLFTAAELQQVQAVQSILLNKLAAQIPR